MYCTASRTILRLDALLSVFPSSRFGSDKLRLCLVDCSRAVPRMDPGKRKSSSRMAVGWTAAATDRGNWFPDVFRAGDSCRPCGTCTDCKGSSVLAPVEDAAEF